MRHVDIETAEAEMECLLDEVEAGQEIVITRDDIPVAKLVPVLPVDTALAG
jgi:prevent-host-death family protein